MRVLGIDPSLKCTGLVLLDTKTGKIIVRRIRLKSAPGFDHLLALRQEMKRHLIALKPDVISIEDPFIYRGRISGATRTFYYHAILRQLFSEYNIAFYEYPPKKWKKLFTANGNAGKGDVVWKVLCDFGYKFYSNDLADAFGLSKAYASSYAGEK